MRDDYTSKESSSWLPGTILRKRTWSKVPSEESFTPSGKIVLIERTYNPNLGQAMDKVGANSLSSPGGFRTGWTYQIPGSEEIHWLPDEFLALFFEKDVSNEDENN